MGEGRSAPHQEIESFFFCFVFFVFVLFYFVPFCFFVGFGLLIMKNILFGWPNPASRGSQNPLKTKNQCLGEYYIPLWYLSRVVFARALCRGYSDGDEM